MNFRVILLPVFAISFVLNLNSQDLLPKRFPIVQSNSKCYSDFTSIGSYENGYKTGVWLDIGEDSAIYRIGKYFKGIPIGEWSINYPDGSIRKKTTYDSMGSVLSWTRFYNNSKIVTISNESNLSSNVYKAIAKYEESVYECELSQFQTSVRHTRSGSSSSYNYMYSDCDVEKAFDGIINIFLHSMDDFLVKYWNSNGSLRKEYFFSQGKEIERYLYEYGGKKLKKRRIYCYGVLTKMEIYDKNENVSKVKTYE